MCGKEPWSAEREAGFTLLEVLVVFTLILFVAGLVYPAGGLLREQVLPKLTLAQLKDDLLELRAQALGGGDHPVLVFEPGADYYLIQWGTLSLQRPLAGLTLDSASENRIDFRQLAGADLTLRATTGETYHLTFDEQGEPVIQTKK